MEILTVVILILLGVLLVLVEFMLVPGVTVAGIGGLLAFIASIFFAFRFWGSLAGIIVLLAILIFIPVLLYFIFKGRAVKKMSLESDIDGKVINIDEDSVKIGDEGETVGRLAPLGKAKFNGVSYETRSLGDYVEPHTKVKIINIEGNTIIVEPIND